MFTDFCSCLCPLGGYHWEMSVSLFFIFPIACLQSWIIFFLNLLFSRLNSSSSLSLSSCIRCSINLIPFVVFCCTYSTMSTSIFSFFMGSPERIPALQVSLTSAEQRGRITFLDLLAMFCLMQSRLLVAFIATRAHYRFMVNMLSTWIETPSVVRVLSSHFAISLYKYKAYSFSGGGLCFSLFRTSCIFLCSFLHPFEVPPNDGTAIWVWSTPPNFESSANLLRAHTVPWFRSLMEMLNTMGASSGPWDRIPMTGLGFFSPRKWMTLLFKRRGKNSPLGDLKWIWIKSLCPYSIHTLCTLLKYLIFI